MSKLILVRETDVGAGWKAITEKKGRENRASLSGRKYIRNGSHIRRSDGDCNMMSWTWTKPCGNGMRSISTHQPKLPEIFTNLAL